MDENEEEEEKEEKEEEEEFSDAFAAKAPRTRSFIASLRHLVFSGDENKRKRESSMLTCVNRCIGSYIITCRYVLFVLDLFLSVAEHRCGRKRRNEKRQLLLRQR